MFNHISNQENGNYKSQMAPYTLYTLQMGRNLKIRPNNGY